MSTFGGIIKEIPNISIDRFDGVNLNSTAYFLSHCHSDHMHGLFAPAFLNRLKEENVYLYCSEISYHILMNIHTDLYLVKESVKIVSFHMEALIDVPSSEHYPQIQNITVTTVPAGHCPGSIMFLFDSISARVLYTGDFRLLEGDIKKLKQFLNSDGKVIAIDTVYLDTTFLNITYEFFPSRKTSAFHLCKLISDWICQSLDHCVHLVTPANYGSEYLFCEIFAKLKIKVHVMMKHFNLYQNIPEVETAITANAALTQIHACGNEPCSFLSYKKEQGFVRKIKPSALWFYNRKSSDEIIKEIETSFNYKIAYSSHSSFSELIDVIRFLDPKKIVPCVVPLGCTMDGVKETIKNIQHSLKNEKRNVAIKDKI